MNRTLSRRGIVLAAPLVLAAVASAPVSAQMQVPRGAVTPMGAPGGFANSPTTTNAQGGQESLTVGTDGKLKKVGNSTIATARPTLTMQRRAMSKTPKGKVVNGVYVAPRSTLPPHP